jgi:hypothetical protein
VLYIGVTREGGDWVIYVFGDYELDTDRHDLRLARVPLRIEPKVFDLLAYTISLESLCILLKDIQQGTEGL